jgi:hypothetical protein
LSDEEILHVPFKLSDAQLTIAREYRFSNWSKLKSALASRNLPHERIPLEDQILDPVFREAVRSIDRGDAASLHRMLVDHPSLVRQKVFYHDGDYFGQPGLLQFVAENPVRHESMPHAVEVATVILDAGATQRYINATLGLIGSGRVAREHGVQVPLIHLLCERGADFRGDLRSALVHGEFEAVEALLNLGAPMTLPIAAATGRLEAFNRLMPTASRDDRHLAVSLTAQFGRSDILRRLLEMGEDPNRYNLPGAHAHSTPLHQAVINGHGETVKLLLDHGARPDIPDTLFHGTAHGWALYAKLPDMVALLEQGST